MHTQRILLASLLALGCAAAPLSAEAPAARTAVSKSAKNGVLTVEVKGWGVTDELAQEDALFHARNFIEHYLQDTSRRLDLPPGWSPTVAEVRRTFVKKLQHQPGQQREVDGQEVQCWVATLQVTPGQLDALQRQLKTRERMGLLAKVVLLAVLGLGAVGGYLHLEERWKLRPRFVLRLGGAAALAAGTAGAWRWL